MTTLVDRFQEPVFAASVILGIVLSIAFKLLITSMGWVVAIILAILISGGLYILYNDYVEKQKQEEAEAAKQRDLERRIKEQAKTEMETGKCISCTAELPEDAEECPECGYAVKHYKSVEE